MTVGPGFVGAGDFHLALGSQLISHAATPTRATAKGLANLDIDGQVRPSSQWDIGIDQH